MKFFGWAHQLTCEWIYLEWNNFNKSVQVLNREFYGRNTKQNAKYHDLSRIPNWHKKSKSPQNMQIWNYVWAQNNSIVSSGKKSKSVFDFLTYSRETGFSFSYEKVEHLDKVSKFDNSLSFGAKQNALQQIFFALWIFKDLFTKNSNWIFFRFFMILNRINKGVYLSFFEHANTWKHVYEHSCSSMRVFCSILAHLAHLAQFFFLILNATNE